jgi:hypothetical protein
LDILLKPKKVALTFSLAVVFLTLANICVQYIRFNYGLGTPRGTLWWLVTIFNVRYEANIPSTYSYIALLFCSALLGVIASEKRRAGDRYARHWFWLAVIFLFLSIDEASSIHGSTGHMLTLFLDQSETIGQFGWLIPYGILVCVVALAYIKFLAALPVRTRRLFVVSGVVFVLGAWVLELSSDLLGTGLGRLGDTVMYSVEEFLEMAAVVVFIYALVSYMETEVKEARIRIASSPAPGKEPG